MIFTNSYFLRFYLRFFNYKDATGIFIGSGSRIKRGTEIGDGSRINGKIIIKGSGKTKIGKYCAFGEDIKIISSNHDMNAVNLQFALHKKIGLVPPHSNKKDVHIGHNVWIGDSVIVLSGVTIGNGAVVAAGSVVTKDIEPYAVAAGVPAKLIKYRFSNEKINEIESSQWWDWSIDMMRERNEFLK